MGRARLRAPPAPPQARTLRSALGLGGGPLGRAQSPLLTARRARVEPGEPGARPGHPLPTAPRPLCTPALRPAPLFTASLCMSD